MADRRIKKTTQTKHLETAQADTPVWLVKVPKFLDAKWKEKVKSEGPGALLGKIKFQSTAEQPSSTMPESFTLTLPDGVEGIPLGYQVSEMSSGKDDTHVISDASDEASLTGKVVKKLDIRPQRNLTENNPWERNWGKVDLDPTYCKLSRERYEAANTKHRTLVQIEDHKGRLAALGKYSGKKLNEDPKSYKQASNKRIRMEKDQLESLLFTLFEKEPNWTISDLVEETNQPNGFLKEVLQGIAVMQRKGLKKGSYELKPEFAINKPSS